METRSQKIEEFFNHFNRQFAMNIMNKKPILETIKKDMNRDKEIIDRICEVALQRRSKNFAHPSEGVILKSTHTWHRKASGYAKPSLFRQRKKPRSARTIQKVVRFQSVLEDKKLIEKKSGRMIPAKSLVEIDIHLFVREIPLWKP